MCSLEAVGSSPSAVSYAAPRKHSTALRSILQQSKMFTIGISYVTIDRLKLYSPIVFVRLTVLSQSYMNFRGIFTVRVPPNVPLTLLQ